MTLKQAAVEFKRAHTSYTSTRSAAARKRLTRAVLKYLKAGGRLGFVSADAREDAVIAKALAKGRVA